MKDDLRNITLVIIDTISDTKDCIAVLKHCSKSINFGAQLAFLKEATKEDGIESHVVSINSIQEYNKFIISKLHQFVKTDFCLIVQVDGFILNPHLWTNDFLNYDYIGAPWPIGWAGVNERNRVGNGGFSLRSKKLLSSCAELIDSFNENEDVSICRTYANLLSSLYGVKFAPVEVAARFSFEHITEQAADFSTCFGFHGKFTEKHKEYINSIK